MAGFLLFCDRTLHRTSFDYSPQATGQRVSEPPSEAVGLVVDLSKVVIINSNNAQHEMMQQHLPNFDPERVLARKPFDLLK